MTKIINFDPSEGVACFTDGSCNSGNKIGGWAYVLVDGNKNMVCDSGHRSKTTINQMELHAPGQALAWLHKEYGSCNVLLYSDSQYVVLGYNEPQRARRKNQSFWRKLDETASKHSHIELNYIPSHRSNGKNFYNGLADALAGEARKEGQNGKSKS